MATASEILQRLNAGEVVFLNSEDVGEFMMECYRHGLSSGAVHLHYQHGRCRMKIPTKNAADSASEDGNNV